MGAAYLTGFGFGFLVAAQVGPIWLLCARTALRGGFLSALAIGLGAATVDTAYACLGVAGVARFLEQPMVRLVLGLVGAAVIIFLGARTLWSAWRIRMGGEADVEVARPLAALRTSLVATASNPLTIATWAAIFAAAAAASIAHNVPTAVALLVGVGTGSMSWFTILSVGMALAGRRMGERGLRLADGLAGAGLIGFGGLLAWQAVHPRG